ncbi:aminotransferase class V-fold PLP-dependent enzyme [Telmatospirillum siberiense]|nr:aminotransferase class V-fold PLP-dependent enzyme [Telmatospirillum siberiense]
MASQSPSFGRSDLFDIPADITYLNAASLSPIPGPVRAAGEHGVARKVTPWTFSRASFYDIVEEARTEAAALVDAQPRDIAIVGSASYGIATSARNLTVDPGKVVLTIEEEHPSPVYVWIRLAAETGAIHEELPRPSDHDWTAAILARLQDRSRPEVGVLSLTPLHWNDGAALDLVAIRAAADEVGAQLVVDGTQSIGARPFSVRTVRPDYLVFPTYKWLLGPYGLAFLYADPDRQSGVPLEEHTFSRVGADLITDRYERELTFMDGARRYDMGERSNFVTLPMAIAGIRLIRAWGTERIAAYLAPLTTRIAERAAELGFSSPPAARRAGHIIGLRKPGFDAGAAAAKLAERKIYVSSRNGAIRVAPHIYNDAADIERFLEGLSAVV